MQTRMGGSDSQLLMKLSQNQTNHLLSAEMIILSQCFSFYLFLNLYKIFSDFQRKYRKWFFCCKHEEHLFFHNLPLMNGSNTVSKRKILPYSAECFWNNPLGSYSDHLISSKLWFFLLFQIK